MCSGLPLSGTVGGRRLPNQPLELFGKIAGAGKTALQSDFCDGKAGCGQLFGSHQKPALAQIFHRPAVQVTAEHPLAFRGLTPAQPARSRRVMGFSRWRSIQPRISYLKSNREKVKAFLQWAGAQKGAE